MESTHNKLPTGRGSRVILGALAGISIAALIVSAARRNSHQGQLIDQKLAALRAAGEPLDSAALGRRYPPPPLELDAMALLRDALPYALANPTPGNTPIVTGGLELNHTQRMDAQSLALLRRHYETTTNIVDVMPVLPRGARFGDNWSNGVLRAVTPQVSFITIRITIQMLCTRALYAAEIGDAEGATAMLERGFRFTDAVPSDSTLVSHMIREACLGLVCRMTERSLNKVQFTDDQLARVLEAMPLRDTNELLGTFRVEQHMAVWAFSELRSGKHMDDISPPTKPRPWWERLWKRWEWRNEYSDEDFLAYLDLIPKVLETTGMPPRQSISECVRLFAAYQSNATSQLAEWGTPNWGKALEAHYRIETQAELTRVALHVERFRLAHRRRPESLAALTPSLLPFAPRDPFDGQPLRFKLLPRGYVLYSVGLDGADDGGLVWTNFTTQTNYDLTVTIER